MHFSTYTLLLREVTCYVARQYCDRSTLLYYISCVADAHTASTKTARQSSHLAELVDLPEGV